MEMKRAEWEMTKGPGLICVPAYGIYALNSYCNKPRNSITSDSISYHSARSWAKDSIGYKKRGRKSG